MKKKSLSLIALLLCCLLIILPVLCSIIYFFSSVSTKLEKTAKETVDFYLDQFTEKTESTLNILRNGIYFLTSDERAQKFMKNPSLSSYSVQLQIEEGISRAMFSNIGQDQNCIKGIFLIKDESNYLPILREGLYSGTARRVLDVYKQFKSANSARDLFYWDKYPDYSYFIVNYLDLNSMKTLGKIIIEINTSKFVNTKYIDSLYKEADVYLTNMDDKIFFNSTGKNKSELISQKALDQNAKNSVFLSIGNEEFYHSRNKLDPYNIKVDVFVPKKEILAAINETVQIYVIYTVIMLILTLLVGMVLYTVITKPIKKMIKTIDWMATGDLSARMETTPYWETEHMVTAFNSMADRLEELFEEVYTKGVLLKDAEFKLLESQIRPHFIFNILEVINMRCIAAGQTNICRMVTNLAQLLRSNILYKHQQKITFEQELCYVRYYLELQKDRFGNDLNYEINIEDDLMLEYFIPKLTIQPLVENSVVHGLENKRGGGYVNISIWEEETSVCVKISDNGIGFDTSNLNLDMPFENVPDKQDDKKGNHVAILNINRRIQLLYGKEYGISITSVPGQGTDIMITLPIDTKQDKQGAENQC